MADSLDVGDLVVWCNLALKDEARARLIAAIGAERIVFAESVAVGNLPVGRPDPRLGEADVAFGQPHAQQCTELPRLRWVHLSSAGFTAFDTPATRAAFTARGTPLSNSSSVFAEPCAQHALAFLLAHARQLPRALENQRGARAWPKVELRTSSRLLMGQTVVLVGMGAIGRRLCALLAPFGLDVIAVRRRPQGDEPVPTVALAALDAELARADFVINLLPGNAETTLFFDATRLGALKPGAVFLNIGRGTTVDQTALASALTGGLLAAAYLDVTSPEPLPADHALWTAPRCVITPHTAGGHVDEPERLVAHFLANLARFGGGQPLADRVW